MPELENLSYPDILSNESLFLLKMKHFKNIVFIIYSAWMITIGTIDVVDTQKSVFLCENKYYNTIKE